MVDISYNWLMEKGELSEYFEKNYLKYQMINGRLSMTKLASIMHFSKGYLSQLMEGKRASVTYHTALFIGVFFNDFSILDILEYEKPDTQTLAAFMLLSPRVRQALSEALLKISESGSEFDSPESVALITSKLNEAGIKVKTNSESLSVK